MHIRCRNCLDPIWVAPPSDGRREPATCERCGRQYRIEVSGNFEAAAADLARKASVIARQNGLDLASAHSVLLGVATLEEMLGLAPAAGPAADAPARGRYDPTFQPAVEAGHLTASEALRRGKRDIYAAHVADRHALPKETAYAVADNRLSLREALRERAPQAPVTIRIESSPGVSARTLLCALGVALALVVAGLYVASSKEEQTAGRTRLRVGTSELFADGEGRIVRVVGSSPDDVLATYCRHAAQGGTLVALGVAPAAESTAVRIGILRGPGESRSLLAIPIRSDAGSGRWYAGDGLRPLVPSDAPAGVEQALLRH